MAALMAVLKVFVGAVLTACVLMIKTSFNVYIYILMLI